MYSLIKDGDHRVHTRSAARPRPLNLPPLSQLTPEQEVAAALAKKTAEDAKAAELAKATELAHARILVDAEKNDPANVIPYEKDLVRRLCRLLFRGALAAPPLPRALTLSPSTQSMSIAKARDLVADDDKKRKADEAKPKVKGVKPT